MTLDQDLALVVQLAALTEDRDPAEQKALERIALRVDRAINRQVSNNPHLPAHGRAAGTRGAPPCSYPSIVHDKTCPGCHGDGVSWEPTDGWSRLTAEVEQE